MRKAAARLKETAEAEAELVAAKPVVAQAEAAVNAAKTRVNELTAVVQERARIKREVRERLVQKGLTRNPFEAEA